MATEKKYRTSPHAPKLLELLALGQWTVMEIVKVTGVSRSNVDWLLRGFHKKGKAYISGYARTGAAWANLWELGDKPHAPAPPPLGDFAGNYWPIGLNSETLMERLRELPHDPFDHICLILSNSCADQFQRKTPSLS